MSKPFKFITNIVNGLFKKQSSGLTGGTVANFNTIASKKGVINYNPTNADYSSPHRVESNNFYVYPIDKQDQEHYILFDIIERQAGDATPKIGGNRQATKRADNLDQVVYGANRFFSESVVKGGDFDITGSAGSKRVIKDTIAIYMPQTIKFQYAAAYGAAEVGVGFAAFEALKKSIDGGNFSENFKGLGQQSINLIRDGFSFLSAGVGAGLGAAAQRKTGLGVAAMQEMIFEGIDYRTFSFTFKFTPRSRKESDVVNNMLHAIKESMLPEKFGGGKSIAAYKVPHEFVIRFMKGTQINAFLDPIGLCACTGVDIDYGSDKFSTHAAGDPVSIDATLTFKELELIERTRYNELRNSARGGGMIPDRGRNR